MKKIIKKIIRKTFIYNLIKYPHKVLMLHNLEHGIILNNALRYIPWIKSPFFPGGGAASYSLLYSLLRILIEAAPQKICELGSGQTTNLFLQFIKSNNRQLISVEGNSEWYHYFSQKFQKIKNFHYIYSPLKEKKVLGIKTSWYSCNLLEKNINLLLIDGPKGVKNFSRVGVIDYIPNILSHKFFIIIDDYQRKGEKQTTKSIMEKLKKHNISFVTKLVRGYTSQFIIASSNYECLLFAI